MGGYQNGSSKNSIGGGGGLDRIELAQDMDKWWVNAVMNFGFHKIWEIFFY
jgi:hypothetical protein